MSQCYWKKNLSSDLFLFSKGFYVGSTKTLSFPILHVFVYLFPVLFIKWISCILIYTYFSNLNFQVERGLKEWTQTEKAVERTIDADFLSHTITGLRPDSYYKIEIRATNEIGNSLPESVVIKTSKGIFMLKNIQFNLVFKQNWWDFSLTACGNKPNVNLTAIIYQIEDVVKNFKLILLLKFNKSILISPILKDINLTK